jgi:alpha-tubulin suppressor-like RCC1 family protein
MGRRTAGVALVTGAMALVVAALVVDGPTAGATAPSAVFTPGTPVANDPNIDWVVPVARSVTMSATCGPGAWDHATARVTATIPGPSGVITNVLASATTDSSMPSPGEIELEFTVPDLPQDVERATLECFAPGAEVASATTAYDLVAISAPPAPLIGTAVAGNESATVSWSASTTVDIGYIVTPYVGYSPRPAQTFHSSATTQTLTGLQNGPKYRFRVQAITAGGTSGCATLTNPVPPTAQAPGAPVIRRNATAFDGEATVSWTAPTTDGGSPITGYRITPYVGYSPRPAQTFASIATTQVVTGLTNGTTYRFRVQAINAVETSAFSMVTNPVTPGSAVDIAAGGRHSCALRASGTVTCWGAGGHGELGNGATDDSSTPVPVSLVEGATAITAGGYHTCAIVADGAVRCWGDNLSGQLGNGSYENRSTPVTVTGISGATQLAAGWEHTCALLDDGAIACWGSNDLGQLGSAAVEDSSVPLVVAGISDAVAVAAGGFGHTCAVLADSTVRCWGWNENGQLGNGTTTDSATPVTVMGLSDVRSIAGGGFTRGHTCVIVADGTVRCWGSNALGQVGDGTVTDALVPATVGGISDAVAVSGGAYHSCALTSGGVLRCWGWNDYGQLGDGTQTSRSTPADIVSLPAVAAVDGGAGHTWAVLADGTARCWGWNEDGQLGNATTTDSATPVTVLGI